MKISVPISSLIYLLLSTLQISNAMDTQPADSAQRSAEWLQWPECNQEQQRIMTKGEKPRCTQAWDQWTGAQSPQKELRLPIHQDETRDTVHQEAPQQHDQKYLPKSGLTTEDVDHYFRSSF